MIEDARKSALKRGLRQLTTEQLRRVLAWPHEMVLDSFQYADGKFCPLAVAIGLPETLRNPSNARVQDALLARGFTIFNTRGVKGAFYTTQRKRDLIIAVEEVLAEQGNA